MVSAVTVSDPGLYDAQTATAHLDLIYILVATAISWSLDWPTPLALPLAPLGIALVTVAWIPPVWAIVLFRREGTEINPTSPANRKLVTSGPYQHTRNPMYLGLVIFSLLGLTLCGALALAP
jgi:protein-S-isoprenylcysteine O-methyltransferase Ste14